MNKTYAKSLLVVLLSGITCISWSQIISTTAGDFAFGAGYSGDGGIATNAQLQNPGDIVFDAIGNYYIADERNNVIRMVNTSGIISTVAGIHIAGYSGDGGPASAAEFNAPSGISIDNSGSFYITDQLNNVVRKINSSGIISTIAGNYSYGPGYSGDGGPATNAELYYPRSCFVDTAGSLYFSDSHNNLIRMVNTSGIITTIAGNYSLGQGYSGDGGPATNAQFSKTSGIAMDASGNFYFSDILNNVVRKVDLSGIITTIAGNYSLGQGYSGDGAQATNAQLFHPHVVRFDNAGNLYITDCWNQVVRKINTSSIISTVVGNNTYGAGYSGDGGNPTNAELNYPESIAFNALGEMYISDDSNNVIRKINSNITGINNIPSTSNQITTFPIPATGSFTVSGISQGQVIEIYNYTGEKILSAIGHQASANFDISNYPDGIYLIRVLNKDGSVVTTKKIVKTE